jgi:hypothetical protein
MWRLYYAAALAERQNKTWNFQVRVESCFLYCVMCQNIQVHCQCHCCTRDCVHHCRNHIWPSNSSFQFNEEQNKMMLSTIMMADNTCYSWKIFNAVVWIWVCWASNWRDHGHGEWRLLVSFVVGYCTGYHCLHETVAWPARKGDIVIKCKLYRWYCTKQQNTWVIL